MLVTMVLMGGEKDGWTTEISPADRPNVYYAVPNRDDDKIKKTHSNDAKRELRDRLGVLAYEFSLVQSTPERVVMVRNAALDRVRPDL